jgi:hypothetical protein
MKTILGLCAALLLSGCLTANVQEDSVCKTNTFSTTLPDIPVSGISAPITLPTITVPVDMSSVFGKLSDVGTVSFNLGEDSLVISPSDVSWITHLTVTITGTNNPQAYPTITLSDQGFYEAQSPIQIDNQIDSGVLYSYLAQGPVSIGFTITGTPPTGVSTLSFTQTLCGGASIHIHKTL